MATYLPNVTDVIPEPALFTPDFSFLDTMLRRRQGLYEQGFAQVNSAYNFVNRNVTNPYSSKVRDTFLKQAQENLKNLSSLDLSQQQNVRMASGVFEPFVKNRGVLADMAVTAHWDQQESIAESFRLKDGGKEYSDDNINYVRLQRQAFANDDISSVGSYYANRRSYSPYYDWNKEMQDAMKNFKPSSVKMERINGMYMVTTKDASWTKEEINKYLSATLSDKAKQQMRIEAAVRFPDLNSVAGLYVSQAAQDLPMMENRIQQVNSALKSEKDPNAVRALQEERDFYTERAKEIKGNIQSIQQGDVEFLKKNAQRLAESIYIGQTVSRIANGFSHTDIEQTIGFNQVAMMYARMAFDREMKEMEVGKAPAGIVPVVMEGESIETNQQILNSNVLNAQKEVNARLADLKDVIVRTDPAFKGRSADSLTEDELDNWMLQNQNSKELTSFIKAGQKLELKKEEVELWNQNAKNYADEKIGEGGLETIQEYEKVQAEVLPQIEGELRPVWDPVKRTYKRAAKAFERGDENGMVDLGPFYYESGGTGGSRASADYKGARNFAKEVAAERLGTSREGLDKLVEEYNAHLKEFNSDKNTIVTRSRKGQTLSVDDDVYKNALGYLASVSGLDKTKIAGIKWFPSPVDNKMQFNLDDANATSPIDREQIKNKLIASGFKATYNDKTDVFTIADLGSIVSPELDPFKGIDQTHLQVINNAESFGGSPGSSRMSPHFEFEGVPGRPQFSIETLFTTSPDVRKYILHINGTPVNNTYTSAYEAYVQAFGLAASPVNLNIILNRK
jgi:hypothetical protein